MASIFPLIVLLFENMIINTVPIVGINVRKLGNGVCLVNAKIEYKIKDNPIKLNDSFIKYLCDAFFSTNKMLRIRLIAIPKILMVVNKN